MGNHSPGTGRPEETLWAVDLPRGDRVVMFETSLRAQCILA